MAEGLQLPDWVKPHIETIESIVIGKRQLKIVFGNPKVQYFIVGQ